MTAITYLHIRGTLSENMIYTAKPGFESRRPDHRKEGNPDFKLALLGEQDRVLVTVSPQVSELGCGSIYDSLRFRVRAALPLHPNGVAYELRLGEIRLYRAEIPAEAPQVSSCQCRRTNDGVTLRWECTSRGNVTYAILAKMVSGRQITLASDLTKAEFKIDLSRIPAQGRGWIVIRASDGIRSSEFEAEAFELEPRPPTVHILSPQNYVRVPFGQPVSAVGICLDANGYSCPQENVDWLLDGKPLTSGRFVGVVEKPEPGEHRLTIGYCMGNTQVETSVTFTVEEPDENYRQWLTTMGELDSEVSPG